MSYWSPTCQTAPSWENSGPGGRGGQARGLDGIRQVLLCSIQTLSGDGRTLRQSQSEPSAQLWWTLQPRAGVGGPGAGQGDDSGAAASAGMLVSVQGLENNNTHMVMRRPPRGLSSKESSCNAGDAGDVGSTPGSGKSPGEGKGSPLQYSCLGNPMVRGAQWATVLGVARVGHDQATEPVQDGEEGSGGLNRRLLGGLD